MPDIVKDIQNAYNNMIRAFEELGRYEITRDENGDLHYVHPEFGEFIPD